MHHKEWNATPSKFLYTSHYNSKKVIWSTHIPNNIQTVHLWELILCTALLIQFLPVSVSQARLLLDKPNAGANKIISSSAYPDLSIKDRVPASVSQAASTRPIHIQYHTTCTPTHSHCSKFL